LTRNTIEIKEYYLALAREVVGLMRDEIETAAGSYTFAIGGESGSGKSTLGLAIKSMLNEERLRSFIFHLDDYFYPYPIEVETFDDEETYQTYGAEQFDDKEDWRRYNVDLFVHELSEGIKNIKSHVKFGISPFGIWRNESTDPQGSDTNGLESYDALYADTKKWVENEWVDYINPQIYWYIENPPAAYEKLVDWWTDVVEGKDVHLYVGHAAYKIGTGGEWDDPEEMPDQLAYNTSLDVKGSVFFSHSALGNNPLDFRERLKNELFKNPALIPKMSWLGGEAPETPELLSVESTDQGNEIKWSHADDDSAYFVIYRFADDSEVDLNNPNHIVDTVRNDGNYKHSFVDQDADGTDYSYAVTAVDRLHHESDPSFLECLSLPEFCRINRLFPSLLLMETTYC